METEISVSNTWENDFDNFVKAVLQPEKTS